MIHEPAELKQSSEVRPITLTKTVTQSGAWYNYFFFTYSLRMFSDNGEHERNKAAVTFNDDFHGLGNWTLFVIWIKICLECLLNCAKLNVNKRKYEYIKMNQIRAGPAQARYGYERSNVTQTVRKNTFCIHTFAWPKRDNREHSNPPKF